MTKIKKTIRGFLTNNLELDLSDISDNSELFSSGLIDSFSLIEILAFLESEFNCKVDISNLSIDELDTIEGIATLALQ